MKITFINYWKRKDHFSSVNNLVQIELIRMGNCKGYRDVFYFVIFNIGFVIYFKSHKL